MQLRGILPRMLQFLLTKPTPTPFRFSVLIGHIIGVALRLKTLGKRKEGDYGQTTGRAIVEANQVGGIPSVSPMLISGRSPSPRSIVPTFLVLKLLCLCTPQ